MISLVPLAAALALAATPDRVSVTVPLTFRAGPPDPACWKCHEKGLAPQLARKTVHPPFRGARDCKVCHKPHAPPAKSGLVSEQVPLCLRCHGGEPFRRANVHSIISGDGCTACHVPHASDEEHLLSEAPAKLCASCHDGLAKAHGGLPVDAPRCLACHTPHTSSSPKLLREVVHGAMPDCSSCHAAKAGKPFALSDKPPALCVQCHDSIEKDLARKKVHPPAKDGDCTSCHSPHVSDRKALLLEARPALCFGCHPELEKKLSATVVHVPVKQGACGECHRPHGADEPKLLTAPTGRLCGRCHAAAARWATQHSSHEPARSGDCTLCHDPHGAGARLLAKSGGELCADCHEVQAGEQKKAARGHPPVARGECRRCHEPHGSAEDSLLTQRPEKLCVSCHGAMYEKRADGKLHRPFAGGKCVACHVAHGETPRLVRADPCGRCHTAAEQRWARSASRHPPVAELRCPSCHEPHGNASPRFLRKVGGELCLGCHEAFAKKIAGGKGILVHAPVEGGECLSCHDPHASDARPLLARAPLSAVCAECHDLAAPAFARRHAKARPNACTVCHDPHVSREERLFRLKGVALCDGCHDRKERRWREMHEANGGIDSPCEECHQRHQR